MKCTCDGCANGGHDPLHAYLWSRCDVCGTKIWFSANSCRLYAYRYKAKNSQLICFTCQKPYYDKNMTSGDIFTTYLLHMPKAILR